jgi:hypothetical protein
MRTLATILLAVMLPSLAFGQEQQVKAGELISKGYEIIPTGIYLILKKSNTVYFCEFKLSPNLTVDEKAAAIANALCAQIRS